MRRITREELRDKLDGGHTVTLIEALPEKYWREAHLPGALQMYYTEVGERAHTVVPDKDAYIVVYRASPGCCYAASRASEASGRVWRIRVFGLCGIFLRYGISKFSWGADSAGRVFRGALFNPGVT